MKKALMILAVVWFVVVCVSSCGYNERLDGCDKEGYSFASINYNKEYDNELDFPGDGVAKEELKKIIKIKNSELIDLEYCNIYTYWVREGDSGYWQTNIYFRRTFPQYEE